MANPTLLLIEDDAGIRESLELGLGLEGFTLFCAGTGSEGLRLLERQAIDVVILDVLLPGADGYSVLTELRAPQNPKRGVPVLMLTALDTTEDRVRGLNRGADDYLVKPFAFSELVARIGALWRRAAPTTVQLQVGSVRVDTERFEAWRGGRRLPLTPKEFTLLQVFLENAARVLSKDALMQHVWGGPVDPNTLEVHISSLRRALGEPSPLRTVRGHGYILDALEAQ